MEAWRAMRGYAWALAAAGAATLAGLAMQPRFDVVNIAMAYVLAVVLVALRQSRGPSIATALFAIVAFDWTFVPPQGAFTVDDAQYLFTFAVLLVLAWVVSRLSDEIRRHAREEARLAMDAEGERIRSTLLASISHDLRTPLAVLTGASSSLAEHGEAMTPAERVAIARSLFARSEEMSAHVDKVLDMTRLDAGAVAPERDWVAVPELVAALRERWAPALARHHVMVELPDGLPLLHVDAALVAKAVGNLLENAARHTAPGTVVRLRAALAGDEVVLSVEDYGAGVPNGALDRVFAKFDHGAVEGAHGGLGLGLAICRAIVRLHGGRAWAERLDGGGMAFRMALRVEPVPVVPAEPEAA